MKYLKLFEEKKYSRNLYYESALDGILKEEWSELSTSKTTEANTIQFETGGDRVEKGYKYSVFFDGYGFENDIYLEETAIPKFIDKFKKEFMKNPEKYVKNFKRDPKFLGDLEQFRETQKYNL